jgi:hypothetical protein
MLTIEKTNNGFIVITYNNYQIKYLYYSKKEALKRFREKYDLKGKHLQIINL